MRLVTSSHHLKLVYPLLLFKSKDLFCTSRVSGNVDFDKPYCRRRLSNVVQLFLKSLAMPRTLTIENQ